MRLRGALVLLLLGWPTSARAIRWTLGLATELTPVVIDPDRPDDRSAPFRLGLRPVLDFEVNRYLAIGAYAPFVVVRTGEGEGAASSGAESVFGLALHGRWPILRKEAPEELLLYAKLRGGFATVTGRAGPLVGGALGVSATWLQTGRGLFAELGVSYISVSRVADGALVRPVQRTALSFALGLVFRLGGEGWGIR